MMAARRNFDDLLEDLAEAVDAAAALVALGQDRRAAQRPLRLAGEAVVGRLGDIATKLPSDLVAGTSELPWAERAADARTSSPPGTSCAARSTTTTTRALLGVATLGYPDELVEVEAVAAVRRVGAVARAALPAVSGVT